jgi:hypothetical protein
VIDLDGGMASIHVDCMVVHVSGWCVTGCVCSIHVECVHVSGWCVTECV